MSGGGTSPRWQGQLVLARTQRSVVHMTPVRAAVPQWDMSSGSMVGPAEGLDVLCSPSWAKGVLKINLWAVDNSWIDPFIKIQCPLSLVTLLT